MTLDLMPTRAMIEAAVTSRRKRLAERIATGRKRCPRCCPPGVTLPIGAFGSSRGKADGRYGYCRKCCAAYASQRRAVLAAEARQRALAAGPPPFPPPPGPPGPRLAAAKFLLRCCSGAMIHDPDTAWWVCEHDPGCKDRWQPDMDETAAGDWVTVSREEAARAARVAFLEARAAARKALLEDPRQSNRRISRAAGLSGRSVAGVRAELEASHEIPRIGQRERRAMAAGIAPTSP